MRGRRKSDEESNAGGMIVDLGWCGLELLEGFVRLIVFPGFAIFWV